MLLFTVGHLLGFRKPYVLLLPCSSLLPHRSSLLSGCDLLSKQAHYDWGLRAVKSVLVVGGSIKRADPGQQEDTVVMRALRDFSLPKIVDDDKPIFLRIISDLFPGIDLPRKLDPTFVEVRLHMGHRELLSLSILHHALPFSLFCRISFCALT